MQTAGCIRRLSVPAGCKHTVTPAKHCKYINSMYSNEMQLTLKWHSACKQYVYQP